MSRPLAAIFAAALTFLAGCAAPANETAQNTDDATIGTGDNTGRVELAFRADDDLNRLTVIQSPGGLHWDNYEARVTSCQTNAAGMVPVVGEGDMPFVNELGKRASQGVLAKPSSNTECGDSQFASLADTPLPVQATDYLDFCMQTVEEAPPPADHVMTSVEVEIRNATANATVDTYIFADFPPC